MEENKLIILIDKYLEEYNKMQKGVERANLLKALYDELLSYLNDNYENIKENRILISILLNEIYQDEVYVNEFYHLLPNLGETKENRDRFKHLYRSIHNDSITNENNLKEMNLRLFRNRYIPSSAKRVKVCLTHNIPIAENKYDIPNIKRILNYFESSGIISNKEELLLINEIELYNRKTTLKNNQDEHEHTYMETLYNEIPNILNSGFQEHDVIEVNDERKPTLDKFIKELLNFIDELDKEDVIENIEKYHNYNLDDNEYNYLVVGILNKYQDNLLTYYQLLIDKDIYVSRKDRLDIIKKYYQILDRYTDLLNYYNKINTFEAVDDENDDLLIDTDEKKELIFSHSASGNKVKMITDMKDVPHEYYDKTNELIDDFINNKLSKKEIKSLKNNGKLTQFMELKYDQIRIVLKHIKDNIYCIMGIGVKKSDNDMTMYRNFANRPIPNISTFEKLAQELELSDYARQELARIVTEKGRKGTR